MNGAGVLVVIDCLRKGEMTDADADGAARVLWAAWQLVEADWGNGDAWKALGQLRAAFGGWPATVGADAARAKWRGKGRGDGRGNRPPTDKAH